MPDAVQPQTPVKTKPPILNIADVQLQDRPPQMAPTGAAAEKYGGARLGQIGMALGAKKLGYSLTVVPPGKRAFPFHNHHINEEMFYIIEGTGELRFGGEHYTVKSGDIIACVPGGKDVAHQLINTGEDELKYLGVSTHVSPDICDYPDTGKFGVLESPEDGGLRFVGRADKQEAYWDGE